VVIYPVGGLVYFTADKQYKSILGCTANKYHIHVTRIVVTYYSL